MHRGIAALLRTLRSNFHSDKTAADHGHFFRALETVAQPR